MKGFFENVEVRLIPARVSHTREFDLCQSCLFRLRHFTVQFLWKLHLLHNENEQVPATPSHIQTKLRYHT